MDCPSQRESISVRQWNPENKSVRNVPDSKDTLSVPDRLMERKDPSLYGLCTGIFANF